MMSDMSVLQSRSIALVGLMGAGKTTIGRRLAKRMELPFFDSDVEIEKASGRTVKGYFNDYGEEAFRDGERRVIARILEAGPVILSTGGGAFIPTETRDVLKANSITVWLRAGLETLMDRVMRQQDKRPLLNVPDPEQAMNQLMEERYPVYAKAHLVVNADNRAHAQTVKKVIGALCAFVAEPA